MKLFICDLPMAFPASEYGGMVVIAAHDQDEMIRVLEEAYLTAEESMYSPKDFDINRALRRVINFDLADGCDTPVGVVRAFET